MHLINVFYTLDKVNIFNITASRTSRNIEGMVDAIEQEDPSNEHIPQGEIVNTHVMECRVLGSLMLFILLYAIFYFLNKLSQTV